MFPTFADPKTVFVFKRIFGAEERKPLLIALLNDLLELEGPHCIRADQHLSLEQHVAVPELELSIVDVKCTDASGRRFVVEMQVARSRGSRSASCTTPARRMSCSSAARTRIQRCATSWA